VMPLRGKGEMCSPRDLFNNAVVQAKMAAAPVERGSRPPCGVDDQISSNMNVTSLLIVAFSK
jgi:hypothetical protein